MRLSPSGRTLIKSFEGLSLKAYPDAHGYSIGYGHFGASPGDVITREEADRLFDQDVIKYEAAVSLKTPRATQEQFDAMTSLAYNIGTGGFADSTVARLHNAGDYPGAADAFRMWNKSQGAVHQGLVARREKERAVYLQGYTTPGSFPTPLPQQSGIGWPETLQSGSSSTAGQQGGGVGKAALVAAFGGFGYLLYRLIFR